MNSKEAAEKIREMFPEEVREIREYNSQTSVIVKRDRIKDIIRYLHSDPLLNFDLLKDLCGVDYSGKKETRFEVVYHLYSLEYRSLLRIRAEVPEDDCSIDSVVDIFAGANWPERECYDLLGVVFKGHPDLRRILLPEDWEGHPLRKDYPLQSDLGEKEWKGYLDVIELAKKNMEFETK
ncbi:MAG: NADH-quinone oxidoreductase subunit C [Nitrospiraceae bacterium]|nr:NADH-quinone oxidoreductase subunit C [Nitrospiraceae bacterium]